MTLSKKSSRLFKKVLFALTSFFFFSTNVFAQRAMYHAGNRNVITSASSSSVSNALDFDGVNDRVIATNDDKFKLSVGTIEGWIKTGNAGSGYCGVFGKTFAYFLYLYNNTLIVYDWSGGGNRSTGITLNDNSWHHIAMSFNSGVNNGTLIYIDGVLKLTTTMTISSQDQPFTIGSVVEPYGQFYTGSIDDVRVWNLVRTQTEIQNNMNIELSGTETGLVAYYTFNQGVAAGDNSAITTVTDKTANALNGNLNNLAKTGATSNFVNGKVSSPIITKSTNLGNALDFDGVNDNVDCGTNSSFNLRSSMTMELWIKPNQNLGVNKWDRLIHKEYQTGYFFGGKNGSTNALAVVLSGDLNAAVTPNNTVVVGVWQHVAFVFDDPANTIKIYKDGVLISTSTWTGTITGNPNSNLTLSQLSSEGYNGSMDDVRIWNVARSQTEIQNNMNSELSGTETGLVAYYTFNQGVAAADNTSITTITDKTANAINGTLNNFAKTGATSNFVKSKVSSTNSNNVFDILLIGGGGGGGRRHGGGGGAGGYNYLINQDLNAGSYTVTVGNGGTGATSAGTGNNGSFSQISSANGAIKFIAYGGGGGGGNTNSVANTGNTTSDPTGNNNLGGGGGGGGDAYNGNGTNTDFGFGGIGAQGGNGGKAETYTGGLWMGAGGGGASGDGESNSTSNAPTDLSAGNGANGLSNSISGSPVIYAGGGGGGNFNGSIHGNGGIGGGGNGGNGNADRNGTNNLGGGGGGNGSDVHPGGNGGSGVVIIKYLGSPKASGGVISQNSGFTIHTFVSSGSFVLN